MPLLDLQRRFRELGRLRMGAKGVSQQSGKEYPKKLSEWRITSASRELLEVVVDCYGGELREWTGAPTQGAQFEVFTGTDRLDVMLPPGEPLNQHWEMWSGGGCVRRCNGVAQQTGEPCACPAELDERARQAALLRPTACKPTTRLSVILPRVPDVGVWRLEAHGMNAAVELPGTVEILRSALEAGVMIPAQLRIDQRTSVKDGETRHFIVPVLELPTVTTQQLMAGDVEGRAIESPPVRAIDAAPKRALPAAPPEPPAPPVEKKAPARKAAAKKSPPPAPPLPEDDEDAQVVGRELALIRKRIADLPSEIRNALKAEWEASTVLPDSTADLQRRHLPDAGVLIAKYESKAVAAKSASGGPFDDGQPPEPDEDFDRRRRWVMAELGNVESLKGNDEARHALVRFATGGRKESTAQLSQAEAEAVVELAAAVASGRGEVARRATGGFEYRPKVAS